VSEVNGIHLDVLKDLNPEPSGETARRILAVAVAIIDSSGESALRIADVMRDAEVQAPMIYRHFGDREGLVQSVHLARAIDALGAEIGAFELAAARANDAQSFEAAFTDLMATLCGPGFATMRRQRLEVFAAALARPLLRERVVELRGLLVARSTENLLRAQRAGWIRCDLDVGAFVEWGIGSTFGLASVEQFSAEPDIAEAWLRIQFEAVSSVLFGRTVMVHSGIAV
jgi:AcrR family transcriptional regulator